MRRVTGEIRVKRKLAVLALIVAMAGCSTSATNDHAAKAVSAQYIYKPAYVGEATGPSEATVAFYRDTGLFGSGCRHDMYVDGVKIFTIRPGEKITIRVSAGEHLFRLETGRGMCADTAISQETSIAAGAHHVYRIMLSSSFTLHLTRME